MYSNVTMGTIQTKMPPQTTTTNKLDKHSCQLIMRSLNEHKLSLQWGDLLQTALDPMVKLSVSSKQRSRDNLK